MTHHLLENLLRSYEILPTEVFMNPADWAELLKNNQYSHLGSTQMTYGSSRGMTHVKPKRGVPSGGLQTAEEYNKMLHSNKFNKKFDDFLNNE